MSWDYDNDRKESAKERNARDIARRRELGESFEQVLIGENSRNLCVSPWGQAWNLNLAEYADYTDRLPAGRRYLRAGHVYDLALSEGEVFAYVTGEEIYEVLIRIDPVAPEVWRRLCAEVGGRAANIVDVIAGNLSDDVMAVLTSADGGLFPTPDEIHVGCNCPDWADLCKHAAAVLYGVGVQLDASPELFFTLRGVDPAGLVVTVADGVGAAIGLDDGETVTLRPEELADLFGIELGDPNAAFPETDYTRLHLDAISWRDSRIRATSW